MLNGRIKKSLLKMGIVVMEYNPTGKVINSGKEKLVGTEKY